MIKQLEFISPPRVVLAFGIVMFVNSVASNAADIRDLPVPVGTIYPSDVITDARITDRRFKVTRASVTGIATQRSELLGRQAKRRLVAGKPIPLSALGSPRLIRKGDSVSSAYSNGGISIVALLTALQDGAEGDTISARNAEYKSRRQSVPLNRL